MKEANEGASSENKQPVEPAPSFEKIDRRHPSIKSLIKIIVRKAP